MFKRRIFGFWSLLAGFFMLVCLSFMLTEPIYAQLYQVSSVGKILDTYKDKGSLMFKDKLKKMQWRDHSIEGTSELINFLRGRGIWLGARNFTDIDNVQHSYYVTLCGFSSEDEGIPVSIERRLRYPQPVIQMDDGTEITTESIDPNIVIDPSMPVDEMIIAKWKTPLGVSVTLRTYAYGLDEFDEFIVQEYIFTNTGDMDAEEGADRLAALENFWIGFTFMTEIGKERRDDRYAYIGRDYAAGGDSLRVFYQWDGDFSGVPGDDTGDPDALDGAIRFQPYLGFAIFHIDQYPHSPDVNAPDDPQQPVTVWIQDGDHIRHTVSNSDQILYEEISKAEIIDDADVSGFQEWPPTSRVRAMLGFGPYATFDVDQVIRLVLVASLGGLNTSVAEELGRQEFQGFVSTEERLQLLATGRDSLLKNISHAKFAFENDFDLPDPPLPPDSLLVATRGGYILVKWSDKPRFTPDPDTGVNDFAGYRLYRSVGTPDGPFNLVETITKEELENGDKKTEYLDYDVSRGVVYYYRVTAFDDGTQNWYQPGKSLESLNITTTTVKGIRAFSQPISNPSQMNKIRVVPNPYNIFGVYNFPGPPLQRNKLIFSNLPPVCTIRIFTVSGDLVATLHHTDGSGDEEWDQITQNDQFILSGVYIAHIESDMGDQVVKFVIVR